MIGILNIDKPAGMTSHDVVAIVRKLAGQRKVGHAGTLDPMATGVLLVCLGDATRISEYLMQSTKVYQATIRLGITTTTDDAQGNPIERMPVQTSPRQIEAALASFVGQIEQVPPKYAAIKINGQKLYELARRGIEVEVPPRAVRIDAIRIQDIALPDVRVEVKCGPGTYIRALARDLGRELGCGAHLYALRRTSSGRFSTDTAIPLHQLLNPAGSLTLKEALLPLDAGLAHLPEIRVPLAIARRLAMGQAIPGPTAVPHKPASHQASPTRAYAPGGRFIAIVYKDTETDSWRPRKVFVQPADLAPDCTQDIDHARDQQ